MKKNSKILIVDDDPNMHRMLELYLSQENYAITTASSARKVLARMNINQYSLIISDLQMPDIDGIAFIGELRNRNDQTPIIVVSAYGDEEIKQKALDAGANRILEKPFLREELIATINKLIIDETG